MVETNALAVAVTTATTGLGAALVSLGYVVGKTDQIFLAAYITKLTSGRTTQTEDAQFWNIATKAWNYYKRRKA
jgi:hypothetical protein